MIKPESLKKGDKIATISLSSGLAGDKEFRCRYEIGKKRLENLFGLKVVEMPNSLKGSKYLSNNPKARAEDMINAFKNKEIKAIFSNIGGDDTLRLLPYIDFDVIKNNPKIFMGYSDTTVNHFMCYKAGLTSYYGPSVLAEFAENVEMHDYTVKWIKKVLFNNKTIGEIESSNYWTSQMLPWENRENSKIKRELNKEKRGYELLQGEGVVKGELIGGCIEVLDWLRGTILWPDLEAWENKILFLETSEEKPTPIEIRRYLRSLDAIGIFERLNALIIAKPQAEKYYEEYKEEYLKVIRDEAKRDDLPIMYNMNFGHTAPMFILPYGVEAEIDCDNNKFRINEAGTSGL
ncbi:muramoyltetrapeptide carboxypeptidase LdcA involved in peptidoglycan recycling [Halanaerobium saccharolyticum]|uniref:Muramoyltetrapeptide carboxypeptidase LdcA involved in peptidoglycan recycling n=2 Tax=Halanaerobium saccharolyticum TaxID=43595 RepID=A0A4R7Z7I0_9FIRM|nr:S66 peptidase family protein [Halanaerobium saccharolyticum]RAK12531.1 muramoyltetrapeptide carboxypeptidase LdcA involved in peptidoglycan recycling [Halanaerobium saccharolyticum]TDW06457.1 muramoyltetrapeptide carboxypeptidase LdcA involved in peptidoglycan recycling [Halanaerobium saccharolyticum]TDX61705.1 muramoyltetrapeptide carboxypeptidase LdcA involved in peptidoglycan recycling [Halanaerobium saccharolyticum]